MLATRPLGAHKTEDGAWTFLVWAPLASRVEIHQVGPRERFIPMEGNQRGYWSALLDDIQQGALYFLRLDGERDRPDPASRLQPQGVHGPSEVVDGEFPWTDGSWKGISLPNYVIYEIHVGTFTPPGTFDAVTPHLDELAELGITALELMPVAAFPGERNWGYDGVFPFAVHSAYGGPLGLKRLVDACHARGIAVILDVVYNHLGPEGNYLGEFGPYFTDRYRTPWGSAINLDGPHSDEVRRYLLENALQWVDEFHVDALRVDAVHAMYDFSAVPFLRRLAEEVHTLAEAQNRHVHLIAESDLNDPRVVRPPEIGGLGLDALWNDDFHHALHALITGERQGYYEDFGRVGDLAKAWREGFVYSGRYSKYRERRHGCPSADVPRRRFVVFSQNHDQVGNRMRGERLRRLTTLEGAKLAAGAVILSPYLPLLFMGEEYGETAPFPYFISHSDPQLIEAVRRGRREEFLAFRWEGDIPDPQSPETFQMAKLDHSIKEAAPHSVMRDYYRELILLRREIVPGMMRFRDGETVNVLEEDRVLWVYHRCPLRDVLILMHFGREDRTLSLTLPPRQWKLRLDSSQRRWGGPGGGPPARLGSSGIVSLTLKPLSLAVYEGSGGEPEAP